jgi:Flp pilus assembly pilin Flp
MREFMLSVQRFLKDESGPTMVEYLFMLSLVIFAALVGIGIVGDTTLELFTRTKNALP